MNQLGSPWKIGPLRLDLSPAEVHVWRTNLDVAKVLQGSFCGWLDEEELNRASKFIFQKDRDRFIAAHVFLREVLSRYLHVDPGEIRFEANEFGKPLVAGDTLEFNLSHSRDISLLAVARNRSVGVDVEYIRSDLEIEAIARRFFSYSEVSDLLSLPQRVQNLAFFSGWTRKEAFIKARGQGLSIPLDGFDVSLLPSEPAALLASRLVPEVGSRWSILDLAPAIGYAGALVVEGDSFELGKWSYSRSMG